MQSNDHTLLAAACEAQLFRAPLARPLEPRLSSPRVMPVGGESALAFGETRAEVARGQPSALIDSSGPSEAACPDDEAATARGSTVSATVQLRKTL